MSGAASIQGVIFDLDGTITHTLPLCIRAFRKAVEPLAGRSFSDEEIVATFGPSEEGTIMALVPDHYERGLAAYLDAYVRSMRPEHGPFPGITHLLAELHAQGMRLALVTGKGRGSAELTLQRYGLTGWFDRVETGSPTGSVKAERIAEIVAEWGMPADRIAYIGDAPSDITAARAAGVRMIAVAWAPDSDIVADQLHALDPDVVANTIADARTWLAVQR